MNKPFKEVVTPEQYANAKKHWETLISGKLPGMFTMEFYNDRSPKSKLTEKNKCGTSACSAGWLPYTLNIPIQELPFDDELGIIDYPSIIETKLGIHATSSGNTDYKEYEWCFSVYWSCDIDNSKIGAGLRMRKLYEEGLPENWHAQMKGLDVLQYKKEL